MRNHDLQFLKRFSLVIAALAALALVLVAVGFYIGGQQPRDPDSTSEARTLERIKPVGGVYAGASGAAAAAAAAEAARLAAASQVAYDGTLDGEVIYGKLCSACHNSGAGGAPLMVKAQWDARVAQGMDTLVRHAIEGFQGNSGLMPARGGNPALTDEQVEASVKWMVDNLK